VDGIDVVAGIIKQLVGLSLIGNEVRGNQRKIAGVEPPQQVIVGPIDPTGSLLL
jgi:hypothetical protein